MPLVLDPERLGRGPLRELFIEQRSGLEEVRERVDAIPAEARRDPLSYRTVEELLDDARALLERIDPATADAATLAAGTNLAYSAMVSAIDLMKSHSRMPTTVPQGPKRPA